MSNRIFIDTLFVIALINRRDQYHQALDLAEQFEGHPLLVTDAVLLEIGNALARSYKQEAWREVSGTWETRVMPGSARYAHPTTRRTAKEGAGVGSPQSTQRT